MSGGDLLLCVLLGAAAVIAGLACYRQPRCERIIAAAGCTLACVILLSALALAYGPPDTTVAPGRGVVTIAPPGPSGGVR